MAKKGNKKEKIKKSGPSMMIELKYTVAQLEVRQSQLG